VVADNLMNPDYALDDPTSRAPRVGTLMRIQSAERTEDSRLALVVQGLVRVRVVEQTQKEPFTRATVQLLPDDEITAVREREGERGGEGERETPY
jgi:Lon protease-like protein